MMNWIDITILIILLMALVRGYSLGIIRQICVLLGMLMGLLLAGQLGEEIEPILKTQLQFPAPMVKPIAYIAAFLLIYLCFIVLGRMLRKLLQSMHLGIINRVLGAFFGALKWMTFISLCIMLMETLDKKGQVIAAADKEQSFAYQPVQSLFPHLMSMWQENQFPLMEKQETK